MDNATGDGRIDGDGNGILRACAMPCDGGLALEYDGGMMKPCMGGAGGLRGTGRQGGETIGMTP
jgi:hypothetical protein